MTANEEILQRCFDNDLEDGEMAKLFTVLGKDKNLRQQYRLFQSMRSALAETRSSHFPERLDERIEQLLHRRRSETTADRYAVRRLLSRRFTISLPRLAAALLLLFLAGYYTIGQGFFQKPATQLVFVYELPPVVVQSHFVQ